MATALTTARLLLRQWRDEDLPAFAALNDDSEVMEFMSRRLGREDSDKFANRIRSHIDKEGWGLWALEVPGVAPFVGFVGLSPASFDAHFTPCVEIGWRLARVHWGNGYATEAARAVLNHGFGALRLAEVLSFTYQGNKRSRDVMERLGMRRDARDDFDHPALNGHRLQRHVLYRMINPSLPDRLSAPRQP